MGVRMKTNEFLYGKGIIPLPVPQYVIDDRVELLDIQIAAETENGMSKSDPVRLKALLDAKEFWIKIIDGIQEIK